MVQHIDLARQLGSCIGLLLLLLLLHLHLLHLLPESLDLAIAVDEPFSVSCQLKVLLIMDSLVQMHLAASALELLPLDLAAVALTTDDVLAVSVVAH